MQKYIKENCAYLIGLILLANLFNAKGQEVENFFISDLPLSEYRIYTVEPIENDNYLFGGDAKNFESQFISSNSNQILIGKNNNAHELIWSKSVTSNGNSLIRKIIKVGSDIYVTGFASGSTNFETTTRDMSLQGGPFLAKLDSEGNFQWTFSIDTEGEGWGISVDSEGNIFWAGRYVKDFNNQEITFINGLSTESTLTLNLGSGSLGFILKISPDGNLLWDKSLGTFGNNRIKDIVIDESNDLFVVGFNSSDILINDTYLIASGIGLNGFLLKMTNTGIPLWHKTFMSNGTVACYSVDINDENVALIGEYQQTLSMQNHSALVSSGLKDVFIASYNKNEGDLNFVRTVNGPGDNQGRSIKIDNFDVITFSGWVNGNVSFNNLENRILTGKGNLDAIIGQIDSNGNLLFMSSVGNSSLERVQEITLTNNNTILASGFLNGSSSLSFSGNENSLINNYRNRGFVVEIDPCYIKENLLDFSFNDDWSNPILNIEYESDYLLTNELLAFNTNCNYDPMNLFDNTFDVDFNSTIYIVNQSPNCVNSECYKLSLDSILINSVSLNLNVVEENLYQLEIINSELLEYFYGNNIPFEVKWFLNSIEKNQFFNQLIIENPENGLWSVQITSANTTVQDSIELLNLSTNNLLNSNFNIKVYPNPLGDILNIESSLFIRNALVKVYDVSGRLVFNKQCSILNNQFELTNLTKGVYILNIEDLEKRTLYIKKLIKN